MSRLRTLVALDLKLAWRHKLVHVTVVVALVFGALIGFALPEELEQDSHDYVMDATPDKRFAGLEAELDAGARFEAVEAVEAAVREDSSGLGIVFEGSPTAPRATVYVQGSESPARLALIETAVDALWWHVGRPGSGGEATTPAPPTVLRPGAVAPPFNASFVPIMFAIDLCLLGFMFAAVMVLQDKEQGVIQLYRVSPGGAAPYIASKLIVCLALSLINFLIMVGLAAPAALALPRLLALVLLTCAGMTLLGISLAVPFHSFAQFFYPMAVVGLAVATPMYMAIAPTQALAWTWWIPSYHVLFGGEALMFGGSPALITTALGYELVFTLGMAALAGVLVSTRLMKDQG